MSKLPSLLEKLNKIADFVCENDLLNKQQDKPKKNTFNFLKMNQLIPKIPYIYQLNLPADSSGEDSDLDPHPPSTFEVAKSIVDPQLFPITVCF